MNPMRTCYVRPPTSPIQDSEGTNKLESQEARKQEVDKQLLQLGVLPQEITVEKGEIFSRLLHEARNKGIYKCLEENTTIYEEIMEEVDEGSAPEYDSDATTTDENEQDSEAIEFPIGKNGKRVRGPTALKRFWKEYDHKNKINVQWNSDGQPCGYNSCRLTNFIGSLVKGKDISCAVSNWSKVPKHEKEKLWKSVKYFFNIPECYKPWVLRTASKKLKNFKSYLKAKYYNDELSLRMNISNGCKNRIPAPQWAWLCKYNKTAKANALSERNRKTRSEQANAVHAVGTRSFAVVSEQEELINGKKPSRAELYRVTHTNKKGQAVDAFSRTKIDEIVDKFSNNPDLICEEPHVGDYYSTLFPKGKKTVRHGSGLVVGGNATEKLARVVSELHATKEENRELRGVVDQLVQSQTRLIARSEKMEKQCSKMMKMLKLAEDSADDSNHTSDEEEEHQVLPTAPKKQKMTLEDQKSDQLDLNKRARGSDKLEEEQTPATKKQKMTLEDQKSDQLDLNKKALATDQGDEQKIAELKRKKTTLGPRKQPQQTTLQMEKDQASSSKTVEIDKMRKVKLEKVEEMKRSSAGYQLKHTLNMNCNCDPCIRKKIRKGMEVGLTSPNSLQLVALGTIQNSDAASVGLDGNPLSDCVEVMVNIVYKSTTKLPRPLGRLTKMGNAQAKCIPWPRNNVTSRDSVNDDSQVLLTAKSKNNKKQNDTQTQSQATEMLNQSKLQEAKSNKETGADDTESQEAVKKTQSQATEMLNQSKLHEAKSNKETGADDTESQEVAKKVKSLDKVIASQSNHKTKKRPRSNMLSAPQDGESQATYNI